MEPLEPGFAGAAGTLASKDVGTRAVTITGVTVSGTGNGNYTLTQQTGLTQVITAKALTKPVRVATVDPLAPLPGHHSGHSKGIATKR